MNRVILDSTAFGARGNLDQSAELCDPTGRVFGYFTPAADRSLYEHVHVPCTEGELDEIEKEPGGRPLAEILADLAAPAMKHTVTWLPSAEKKLAEIWETATDQNLVTAAANRIDSLLRVSPTKQGESRPSGRRILIVPPLAVIFKVSTEDRLVRVHIV